jgi:hypothetical protein
MSAESSADVRCTCGAWSAARDEESIRCVKCASAVTVPFDVRLYLRFVAVPTQDTVCCVSCGHSLRPDSRRCRWCKIDVVARVRRPANAFMRERYPVALRSARGVFCGFCSHALERAPPGRDREFMLCAGCGRDNRSTHVQSMLAMQRDLAASDNDREAIAALDRADAALREARPPRREPTSWLHMLGYILWLTFVSTAICGVLYAVLSSFFVMEREEPPPYTPRPLPTMWQIPPELLTFDAGARD